MVQLNERLRVLLMQDRFAFKLLFDNTKTGILFFNGSRLVTKTYVNQIVTFRKGVQSP